MTPARGSPLLVALAVARDRRVVSSSRRGTAPAPGGRVGGRPCCWRRSSSPSRRGCAPSRFAPPRSVGCPAERPSFASTRSRPCSCRSRRVCGCSPSPSRRAPRSIGADCAGRPSPRSSRSPRFSPRARSCSCSCRWPRSGRSCPRWRTRRISISAASWRRIWASRRCSLASGSRC